MFAVSYSIEIKITFFLNYVSRKRGKYLPSLTLKNNKVGGDLSY